MLHSSDPTSGSSAPALRSSNPALRSSDPASRSSDPASRSSDPASRSSDPALRSSDPAPRPSAPVTTSVWTSRLRSTTKSPDPVVRDTQCNDYNLSSIPESSGNHGRIWGLRPEKNDDSHA